ncbi:MAG TPA: GNAT family N-acetyltransferase, partial [Jatrophihabitans sp.]|nr:GNAT family N-acetyltransferase [Jatrophihabitans sp.]
MQSADGYEFDDDPSRIDVDAAWRYLNTDAYWGRWRQFADFAQQLASAWRVVGCYAADGSMVGFARAISDGVALAYLADVYVDANHRGRRLGTRLVQVMIDEGPGRHFRWMLHTRDAHGLYAKLGFTAPDETYLERPS